MLPFTLSVACDLLLALGVTLRLTRLIITDDLGRWWLLEPMDSLKHRYQRRHAIERTDLLGRTYYDQPEPRWAKYLSGLTCPFCVGFWIACAVLASLAAIGGPGSDSLAVTIWRYVAGAFTLNYVAAHLGVRLGDAGYDDEE